MQVQDRYREVEDNCKTFLGNLRRDCGPEDVRAWLNGEGYKLAIPCKMVIRGRSGIRRGLDALTRGVGLPPIKVAPSSKLEHILFRFKLDEVNLPAALVHSVRFLTAQTIVLAHPRAHRGGGDRPLRRLHMPVRDPPATGTPWAFSRGVDVGWSTKVSV